MLAASDRDERLAKLRALSRHVQSGSFAFSRYASLRLLSGVANLIEGRADGDPAVELPKAKRVLVAGLRELTRLVTDRQCVLLDRFMDTVDACARGDDDALCDLIEEFAVRREDAAFRQPGGRKPAGKKPRHLQDRVLETVKQHSLSMSTLTPLQCHARLMRWRRTFAQPASLVTGRWRNGGSDWHTFAYSPAAEGKAALRRYRDQRPSEVFVLGDGTETFAGVRLVVDPTAPLPDLGVVDVLVFPADLSWTMAFTHERPELGPYFSRAEEVAKRVADLRSGRFR